MCQALMEIMSDEVQARVDEAVKEAVGSAVTVAMDALKIPESNRAKLLA